MRFINKILLSLLLAILCGCTSVKNEPSMVQKIVVGKTTKAEIQTLFNSPRYSSLDTGLEVWEYQVSKMNSESYIHATALDYFGVLVNTAKFRPMRQIQESRIVFDQQGIVKTYSSSTFPMF